MKWKSYTEYVCQCGNKASSTGVSRKDGSCAPRTGNISKMPVCSSCLIEELYRSEGGKEQSAINEGFISIHHKATAQRYNSLKLRIHMCENAEGKLGFECRTHNVYYFKLREYLDHNTGLLKKEYHGNIEIANKINDYLSSIHVDHIDGNPENNSTRNLMVLCPHCHTSKGKLSKDHLSKGKKAEDRRGDKFNIIFEDDLSERYEVIERFGKLHNLL